jgi:hypothetical protein
VKSEKGAKGHKIGRRQKAEDRSTPLGPVGKSKIL